MSIQNHIQNWIIFKLQHMHCRTHRHCGITARWAATGGQEERYLIMERQ